MALLRWMHLRKLVPLTELMEQLGSGRVASAASAGPPVRPALPVKSGPPAKAAAVSAPAVARTPPPPAPAAAADGPLKDAFLGEIRAAKTFFYNTVVAQAQRIDVAGDAITFSFLPNHRALREQFDQAKGWLESAAHRLAGRRITVSAVQAPAPQASGAPPENDVPELPPKRDLKAEAMSSSAVQAVLDVFPAEIRDVEEM